MPRAVVSVPPGKSIEVKVNWAEAELANANNTNANIKNRFIAAPDLMFSRSVTSKAPPSKDRVSGSCATEEACQCIPSRVAVKVNNFAPCCLETGFCIGLQRMG